MHPLRNIGTFQVDVLPCGEFWLDGGAMFGVVPRAVWERLTPPDEANRIRLQTNCMLIRGQGATVVVDTGVGQVGDAAFRRRFRVEEGAGLATALRAAGVEPGEVTHVVLSHLHWDHAGGATARGGDGQPVPTFPRARYVVQRGEWQDAQAPTERTRGSYLPECYRRLESAGCLDLVDGNVEILPGLRVLRAPGHNRHMQVVRVEGCGAAAVYLADLVPTRHHLRLPYIMAYDLDAATTLETKRRLLDEIESEGALVVFDHDPEVPVARLARDERGHHVAVAVDGPC